MLLSVMRPREIMLGFVLDFSHAQPKFTRIYGHETLINTFVQLSQISKCQSMMMPDPLLYILTKKTKTNHKHTVLPI